MTVWFPKSREEEDLEVALRVMRALVVAVPHYVEPTNPRVHVFGGGDGVDTKKEPCPMCEVVLLLSRYPETKP